MQQRPVLVVGTTPDYVAKIHAKHPESTVFVLDVSFLDDPLLDQVDEEVLVFSSLENFDELIRSVRRYLSYKSLDAQGVACFDCESLIGASRLAHYLGKPFPKTEAIVKSRDKFQSRTIWRKAGLFSPQAALVSSVVKTVEFFHRAERPVV